MTPDRIDSGLEQLSRLAASKTQLFHHTLGSARTRYTQNDVTARAERLLRLIEGYVAAMPKTSKLDRALRRAVRMVPSRSRRRAQGVAAGVQ
jgi:hypothetical protein